MSFSPIPKSKRRCVNAHANCAGGSDGDFTKPNGYAPIFKKNVKTPPHTLKQTPVHRRNVSRVQISPVENLKKYSSCQNLNVIQKDTTIALCNKSKSHGNIATNYKSDRRICAFRKTIKIMGDNEKLDVTGNKVIKEACTAFLLNAWRHRRQEVAEIKKQITSLENQTTDLRVQIMSLWQLLESEKARLAQANLKAMQQHRLAEDAIVNNKNLTAANSNQQKEISELNKELLSLRIECNNQKNELIVAKQEIFSLHNQMDKERVKVAKLREDKKILLDKAHLAESEAKRKGALLVQIENEQKEKDENQIIILQNLQEKNIVIEGLNAENATLRFERDRQIIDKVNLEMKISELEKLLQEKEKEIETLKSTTEKYMVEAVQMKLAALKPQETDDNWAIYVGKRITASIIMALIPLLQNSTFP